MLVSRRFSYPRICSLSNSQFSFYLLFFSVAVSGSAIFDLDSANFSRPGTAGEGRPSSRCSRSVGRVGEAFFSLITAYQNQRN